MYLLKKIVTPSEIFDSAIYALIEAGGLTGATARQERIRRAAFYDRYAAECLWAVFPDGIPSKSSTAVSWGVRPTVELVERAADACYELRRMEIGPKLSQVKLECRFMLQGFLGVAQRLDLASYQWDLGLPSKHRSLESIESEERAEAAGWRAAMAEIDELIRSNRNIWRQESEDRALREEQSRELQARVERYGGRRRRRRRRVPENDGRLDRMTPKLEEHGPWPTRTL